MRFFLVSPQRTMTLSDGTAIGMDELLSTLNQFVRQRRLVVSNAFPEQYPLKRIL